MADEKTDFVHVAKQQDTLGNSTFFLLGRWKTRADKRAHRVGVDFVKEPFGFLFDQGADAMLTARHTGGFAKAT